MEPDKAYDIIEVTLRSAPKTTRPAVVLVKHGRAVKPGDAIDVWFDFDGDKVPDIHVSGDSFSEFTVHESKSFTKDGKDISNKDCARLAMGGSVSKVRLFPACVDSPLSYRGRGEVLEPRTSRTAPTTGRRRPRSSPRRCSPRR